MDELDVIVSGEYDALSNEYAEDIDVIKLVLANLQAEFRQQVLDSLYRGIAVEVAPYKNNFWLYFESVIVEGDDNRMSNYRLAEIRKIDGWSELEKGPLEILFAKLKELAELARLANLDVLDLAKIMGEVRNFPRSVVDLRKAINLVYWTSFNALLRKVEIEFSKHGFQVDDSGTITLAAS